MTNNTDPAGLSSFPQYRVIADRDKGDDPQLSDIQVGDRFTYLAVGKLTDRLVRIERPGPTTAEPPEADATPDEAFELGEVQGYDKGYADGLAASPHPPTREQIAEAIYAAQHPDNGSRWLTTVDGSPNVVSYVAADAVLALIQNGADR